MPETLTIAEFKKIHEKEINRINQIQISNQFQVIVSFGTPAIAAGAHETYLAFQEEIQQRNLHNVLLLKTGNSCLDSMELVVRVLQADQPEVRYGHVTPEIAGRIVDEHLLNGKIVKSNHIAAD